METKETIEVLKRLQEIDRRIAHFRRMEEYEPKRLSRQEADVTAEQARLAALGDRHSQIQREIGRKELDVKARQEKINRLKSQMMGATTNKEYQAFLKEVSLEEVEKSRVEDELLELMISTENFAAEEASIKAAIQKTKEDVTKIAAEVKAALAAAAAERLRLADDRQKVADTLDADTLRRYEALFKSRAGEAVAAATYEKGSGGEEGKYLCRGCFMPLTHQMLNLLLIGREVITCKSCGRILYIEDHKEE